MKEMLEEYGSTIATVLTGVAVLTFLLSIFIPNNPIRDIVLKFLTITMPFAYHG